MLYENKLFVKSNDSSTHPVDLYALLEGLAIVLLLPVVRGTFQFEPHALHLVQVIHGTDSLLTNADGISINRQSTKPTVAMQSIVATDPGELGAHLFGLLEESCPQHVLGALGIDVSVCGVQRLGLVQTLDGIQDVARVLSNER